MLWFQDTDQDVIGMSFTKLPKKFLFALLLFQEIPGKLISFLQ